MTWFAFPKSVLSKPTVWLGDYAFISKRDSRLCAAVQFLINQWADFLA